MPVTIATVLELRRDGLSGRDTILGRPCGHCKGAGWMCEAHPDQLADHDPNCDGPAVACPHCQPQTSDERPHMPSGWRSSLEDEPDRLIAASDARARAPISGPSKSAKRSRIVFSLRGHSEPLHLVALPPRGPLRTPRGPRGASTCRTFLLAFCRIGPGTTA
jgi:hypothetical protein